MATSGLVGDGVYYLRLACSSCLPRGHKEPCNIEGRRCRAAWGGEPRRREESVTFRSPAGSRTHRLASTSI